MVAVVLQHIAICTVEVKGFHFHQYLLKNNLSMHMAELLRACAYSPVHAGSLTLEGNTDAPQTTHLSRTCQSPATAHTHTQTHTHTRAKQVNTISLINDKVRIDKTNDNNRQQP